MSTRAGVPRSMVDAARRYAEVEGWDLRGWSDDDIVAVIETTGSGAGAMAAIGVAAKRRRPSFGDLLMRGVVLVLAFLVGCAFVAGLFLLLTPAS